MKRIICALLCAVMLACCLTGCVAPFDARAYVQGNLDIVYFGKATEQHLELIKSSEEEVQEIYERALEIEAEYFATYFDIVLETAPEGTKERIIELYRQIYSYTKYVIGEPTKSGENYLVSITVYPLDIMQQIKEDGWLDFESAWMAMSEEIALMTEEEIEALWADMIISMVEEFVPYIGYMDPETISIEIAKDYDGIYVISDNDFGRIDTLIIKY